MNMVVVQVENCPLLPTTTALPRSMGSAPSPVIHEVLPSEVLSTIFEEHAKLEWRAPAIDARVCRVWNQIVLKTPRAWAYLEISGYKPYSIAVLRSWLNLSVAAPLHIHISPDIDDSLERGHIYRRKFLDLLHEYYTRIASLRITWAHGSFFEGREFPRLHLLDLV